MPLDATGFPITQRDCYLAILHTARDGIAQPNGWCQNTYQHGSSRCAAGWIAVASGHPDFDTMVKLSRLLLRPSLPLRWRIFGYLFNINGVGPYNDVWWRRQTTMIRLFDRAIRKMERTPTPDRITTF